MTVYRTPYNTIAGSTLPDKKKLEKQILPLLVAGNIKDSNLDVITTSSITPIYITGKNVEEDNIPLFTHSINLIYKDKEYLCTDLRLVLNKKQLRNDYDFKESIRNSTEYNFLKGLSIATLAWSLGEIDNIRTNMKYAAHVFTVLLSGIISSSYSLDLGDKVKLNILGLIYYRMLFEEKEELDNSVKEISFIQCQSLLGVSKEVFDSVANKLTKLSSINDYCESAKSICESTRLDNLNLPMLLTLLKSVWYGTNAKDYIGIALEHPPTWVSLLYVSLTEKTYKRSKIYSVAFDLKKGSNIVSFTDAYKNFVSAYTKNISKEEFSNLMDSLKIED